MLDLNFVRDHLPQVEEMLAQRGMNAAEALGEFRQLDGVRRRHITELEGLQARRNTASDEIARLKKAKQDTSVQIAETKDLREKIQVLEGKVQEEDARLRELLAGIPNMPNASVPVGKVSEDNVEVRRWGKLPEFAFAPKPHWELGEQLGVKLNSCGVPHLRTSLLSSAERPTGTDSCGTLGIPASIARISWSISPACFSSSSLCARKALVCSICAVASCPAFLSLAISSDARFRCAFRPSD